MSKRHTRTCRAYGNWQPPYEDCSCGADDEAAVPSIPDAQIALDKIIGEASAYIENPEWGYVFDRIRSLAEAAKRRLAVPSIPADRLQQVESLLRSLEQELLQPEQMSAYRENPALIVQAAKNLAANEAHYRQVAASVIRPAAPQPPCTCIMQLGYPGYAGVGAAITDTSLHAKSCPCAHDELKP